MSLIFIPDSIFLRISSGMFLIWLLFLYSSSSGLLISSNSCWCSGFLSVYVKLRKKFLSSSWISLAIPFGTFNGGVLFPALSLITVDHRFALLTISEKLSKSFPLPEAMLLIATDGLSIMSLSDKLLIVSVSLIVLSSSWAALFSCSKISLVFLSFSL